MSHVRIGSRFIVAETFAFAKRESLGKHRTVEIGKDLSEMQLTTFRADVTPPIGHPLCAGWMPPAVGMADPLHALGLVLFGEGAPVVLVALDWCEISNRSHIQWRERIAAAVGTKPDRVAVQCVHPHCTPWPDEEAQRLVSEQSGILPIMDPKWCGETIGRVAAAARIATMNPQTVTHIEFGRAKVEKVASNRRILGPDGKVKAVRWTKTLDPAVRAEPEGLIDPWLKTISFWNGGKKLAVLHYYAVHPTSYDNDSTITPDFTGLARERRSQEDGGVPHIYFTECAGNITAGKYNDGAKENRPVLTDRIYRALVESEQKTERVSLRQWSWRTKPVQLPPLEPSEAKLSAILRDPARSSKDRCRAAMQISYLRRSSEPIPFMRLSFDDRVHILHLPGEPFMEYQIFAQQQRPDGFVAVAGYGDCGPGYVCMEKSFTEGGYEPTDSFVAPQSEAVVKAAIAELMQIA
jgi:hypothetical protein